MTTKSRRNVDFLIANFYHKCLSKSSVITNQLFASFNAVVIIYDKLFLGNNFVKRLKAGVNLKAVSMPLKIGLMETISFSFQEIKKLSTYPVNLCCWVFCEFLGEFWVCLGGDSFSRRIGKIKRNMKYLRFGEVLKLQFVVNN